MLFSGIKGAAGQQHQPTVQGKILPGRRGGRIDRDCNHRVLLPASQIGHPKRCDLLPPRHVRRTGLLRTASQIRRLQQERAQRGHPKKTETAARQVRSMECSCSI